MTSHYLYLVTDKVANRITKTGNLCEEISHTYLNHAVKDDTIWFVQVTDDYEDALILGLFHITSVVSQPKQPKLLRRNPGSAPVRGISLAEHQLYLNCEEGKSNVFGMKCCKYGVKLAIDPNTWRYDRGFRTGMKLDQQSVSALEAVFRTSFGSVDRDITPSIEPVTLQEEITSGDSQVEGDVFQVLLNVYERNPIARKRCLEHHGTSCILCNFNFGAVYGPLGDGFIHVHHLQPLSEIGESYIVDPIRDLRPVCPNCHAIIHLGGGCRSLDEVRQLLKDTHEQHHPSTSRNSW